MTDEQARQIIKLLEEIRSSVDDVAITVENAGEAIVEAVKAAAGPGEN